MLGKYRKTVKYLCKACRCKYLNHVQRAKCDQRLSSDPHGMAPSLNVFDGLQRYRHAPNLKSEAYNFSYSLFPQVTRALRARLSHASHKANPHP